jgi:predicted Zn-dependent protease
MLKHGLILSLRLFFIGLLIISVSCARNPVTGKKEFAFMSEQQEIALGANSNPQIIAEFGEYNDQKIQAFIDEKGQQMAKISHRPNLPFHFKVLDSDVVNAFALPGGYVYFTRGIMAHFNNEAEFAGVLGHEIGHVTARHGVAQQSQGILVQLGLIVGMVAVPELAQFGNELSQGAGLLMLKFGRDDESQSDKLGVEYSTKVGYDAREMAGFFKTISRLSGGPEGRVPTFMSTHPDPLDRNKKVGEMAEAEQKKSNNYNLSVNRDGYLRMIDGIAYGPDPQQGYVESGVFYHPQLKFQFPVPSDWRLQNSPQQVQMAPKDGKAMAIFTLAQQQSLREAANAAIAQDSFKLLNSQNVTVNGYQAIAMTAEQLNRQTGKTIRALIYVIQADSYIYKFYGLSLSTDFQNYEMLFQNTFRGFRELRDPNRINVFVERVKVKEVNRAGTLADYLRSQGITDKRLEEHAILNGMEQTEQVNLGMLIKVIEKGSGTN